MGSEGRRRSGRRRRTRTTAPPPPTSGASLLRLVVRYEDGDGEEPAREERGRSHPRWLRQLSPHPSPCRLSGGGASERHTTRHHRHGTGGG